MHPHRDSNALKSFMENCDDVPRLLEIHEDIAGTSRGRKYDVEVLNKSAIVLTCAFWEAYNEDICIEGVNHICKYMSGPDRLPASVKKIIARELKSQKHELAVWKLSGDGWKHVLRSSVRGFVKGFNTPKSENLISLFRKALGIKDITAAWARPYLSREKARSKIDNFVTLRGDIAHRGKPAGSVRKKQCEDFVEVVEDIVQRADGYVIRHLQHIAPMRPSMSSAGMKRVT